MAEPVDRAALLEYAQALAASQGMTDAEVNAFLRRPETIAALNQGTYEALDALFPENSGEPASRALPVATAQPTAAAPPPVAPASPASTGVGGGALNPRNRVVAPGAAAADVGTMGQPPYGWTALQGADGQEYWQGPGQGLYNPRTGWLRGVDGNVEQYRSIQDFRAYYGPGGPEEQLAPGQKQPYEGSTTVRGTGEPITAGDPNYDPNRATEATVVRQEPRVLTAGERAVAAARDAAEKPPGAPQYNIRPLSEIVGTSRPGQAPQYGRFTGQELEKYLPVGTNNAGAAPNLMRLMGYEPNQGNPNVGFLESLIPDIARQTDLQRRLNGGLAMGTVSPDATQEQADQIGQEGRMRLLGDISGTMGTGATSAVTPQQGMALLDRLNSLVNNPQEGDLTGLQAQYGGRTSETGSSTPDSATASFQALMDTVGGGMSPTFSGNRSLQTATMRRLYENYQNRGTEQGGSFLNYLLSLLHAQNTGVVTG